MYKILKPFEKGLFTRLIGKKITVDLITQAELKELVTYDYTNGTLAWINLTANKKKGAIGSLSKTGYLLVHIKGRIYRAHRLVWLYVYGEHPSNSIDHIDCNKVNNRVENLREATLSENQKNQGIPRHNTSGFKGVCWHKKDKKWATKAMLKGKNYYLGSYDTPEEASKAYNDFCLEHHGKFYKDTR